MLSRNVSKCEFLKGEDVLQEKELLKEGATIKRIKCSPLGGELKKQTGIEKGRYKLFKYQVSAINNNREVGVKTEDGFKREDKVERQDGEIIDKVHQRYYGDQCKYIFFYLSFCSTNIHESPDCRESGRVFFNSSLSLPSSSQTLRH